MNIEELISQYLDGSLSSEAESDLHHRLAVSPEARKLFRSHIMLRGIARDQRVLHVPAPEVRNKLFQRLAEEEGMRMPVAAAAPVAAPVPVPLPQMSSESSRPIAAAADRRAEPSERRRRRVVPWLVPSLIASMMLVVLWKSDWIGGPSDTGTQQIVEKGSPAGSAASSGAAGNGPNLASADAGTVKEQASSAPESSRPAPADTRIADAAPARSSKPARKEGYYRDLSTSSSRPHELHGNALSDADGAMSAPENHVESLSSQSGPVLAMRAEDKAKRSNSRLQVQSSAANGTMYDNGNTVKPEAANEKSMAYLDKSARYNAEQDKGTVEDGMPVAAESSQVDDVTDFKPLNRQRAVLDTDSSRTLLGDAVRRESLSVPHDLGRSASVSARGAVTLNAGITDQGKNGISVRSGREIVANPPASPQSMNLAWTMPDTLPSFSLDAPVTLAPASASGGGMSRDAFALNGTDSVASDQRQMALQMMILPDEPVRVHPLAAVVGLQQNSLVSLANTDMQVQVLIRAGLEFGGGDHQIFGLVSEGSYGESSSDSLLGVMYEGRFFPSETVSLVPAEPTTSESRQNEIWVGAGYRYSREIAKGWRIGIGVWSGAGERYFRVASEIPVAYQPVKWIRVELLPTVQYTAAHGETTRTATTGFDPSARYSEKSERTWVLDRDHDLNLGIGIGAAVIW